jgi:hypothetical protein
MERILGVVKVRLTLPDRDAERPLGVPTQSIGTRLKIRTTSLGRIIFLE